MSSSSSSPRSQEDPPGVPMRAPVSPPKEVFTPLFNSLSLDEDSLAKMQPYLEKHVSESRRKAPPPVSTGAQPQVSFAKMEIETESATSSILPRSPHRLVEEGYVSNDRVVLMSRDLVALKDMLEENDTCLVCKAASSLIESAVAQTADIPLRQEDWFEKNFCRDGDRGDFSSAFELPDWQYHSVHGTPSLNFQKNLRRTVTACTMILNMADAESLKSVITEKERKAARHLVAGNPYIIYGCHLRDTEIAPYERNEIFFRKLYRIRQRCGFNQDFGYLSRTLYQAQSEDEPQEEDPDAEEAFSEQVPQMRDKLRALFTKGIGKIKDWSNKVVSIFFGAIGSVFGLVSLAFGKVMDAVKSFCAGVIKKLFDIEKLMLYCHTDDFKNKIITTVSIFLLLSVAVIFGLQWYVTDRITEVIIRSFANHGFVEKLSDMEINNIPQRHQHWLYKAQNQRADPVACAVTIAGMIWNFSGQETTEIKKKASIAMDLMRLGTVVSSVTTCVYALMPVVIKEAIAWAIESPTERMKRTVYEWCTLGNELSKLQQISSVIAHPHYKRRVDSHLAEGVELLKKITGPTYTDVRGYMVGSLMQLYKLATILMAMSMETLKRDEPYSVHVCGVPGVGKSLIVESILQRAHDIHMEQIYAKNCGEVFFSGYHNGHKAVIMDEFCVGSSDVREQVARVYLGLVSSSQTRLEMASLNDPRVGIKGTCFSSDFVYTINNTAYDTVEGIPREALWRRRDVVVELMWSKDTNNVRRKKVVKTGEDGQSEVIEEGIDFSAYTTQEIYDAVWMEAVVRPGSPPNQEVDHAMTVHRLSLPALCEFLHEREAKFRERQALVREAFGSTISDKIDPMHIIDNVFRKDVGLPEVESKSEKSMPEKLFGVFFGQGPIRPPRHFHDCPHCQKKRRHTFGIDYLCDHCGETSRCIDGEHPDVVEPPPHSVVFQQQEVEESLHRIACLNTFCTRQKAVKTGVKITEPWMCSDCLPKFEKPENMVEINRYKCGLPVRTDIVHQDLESWKRAVMSELENVPMRIWCDMVVPTTVEHRIAFETIWSFIGPACYGYKIAYFSVMLLGAVCLRRMRVAMGDEKEEEEITFGPTPEDFEGQALYDRSTRTKTKRSSLFAKRAQKGASYKSQAGGLVKSLKLRIGNANLVCCPIGGRDLLLFHHAIVDGDGQTIEGPIEMSLTIGKEVYEGVYTDDIVRSFPERDFMILRFPNKRLPNFKDVRRYFLSRDNIDEFQGKCLVKVDSPRAEMFARCDVIQASYTAHGHVYEMPKLVRYHCDTINGDCGSPVFCASGNAVGAMIGIHVAGTGDSRNPQGLATLIAREDLDELIELFDDVDVNLDFSAQNMDSVENYQSLIADGELPNLREVVAIPKGRQMHCSDKSKLKPSLLSTVLDWVPEKAPAILSDRDPRAGGQDPIDVAVKKLGRVPVNDWPDDLKSCGEIALSDMTAKYTKLLDESGYFEKVLTLREAIAGVPGLIKSIDTSTCAGYPIGCTANKNGKKSVIHHEDSECVIDENFLKLCEQLETDMMNYDGEEIDYAFQAFGKDELRSQKKLKNVDTRLTYANDIIFNSVVRKRTAVLMLALCKSFGKHGMAISLNPQSNDMQKIYSYLREAQPVGELGVIDGDYSEFDIRHPEWVIRKIFRFICDLMKKIEPNERFWTYVIKHEVDCGATVKTILYRFRSILCSGSLFTTLFNCFVNEFYFRVNFIRNLPWLSFDKEARIVVLGDDHLLSLSEKVDWTPVDVGEMMTTLGLKYTSARKNEELRDERTPFGRCLFLGSVPQNHHGLWSGALRKETLRESLLWTRNKDRSMDAEVTQMIEAASQWDKEYYTWYVDTIREAYKNLGRPFPEPSGSWEGLGRSVGCRTTDSGADFPIYRAQMEGAVESNDSNVHVDGMTTLKTDTEVTLPTPPQLNARSLIGKAVNERDADLGFGPRSLMKRNTVTWSSVNAAGTALQTSSCPFGLLSLGDQHNLQNMAFQNFLYTTTNVKVVFQVNGTPTQAGLAIAYFVPLLNYTPDRDSKPSFQKVWITPSMNTTVELNIDFNYWRSTLNTLNAAYFPEVMGYVKVDVYSPLISLSASTCDITTYVSFEADFKIPRPFAVPAVDGTAPLFGVSKNSGGTLNVAPGTYVGQGSNVSTTNVNNSYQVGDIGGDMPIQTGVDGGGKLSQTADVQAVPMDNPPVSGGAVPTVGQFSSMSKSNGAEITTALQLHQQEMSYQPIKMRAALDTNIQELCGKQGRVANFAWNTTQLNGTSLYTLNLDSCFSMFGINSIATSTQLPTNVAVLNQFMFWRGDFVFDVCVVKTAFHSGRIMASVAYGDNTVNLSELNVYMNNVLDFNGDAAWQSFRVNYNNSQEYLRTWNGPGSARARDVSLGTLQFSVLNELRATSEVVSSAVDVLLFVRFENVRVAVPKPMPIVNIQTTQPPFIAQGDNVLSGASDAPDQGPTEVVDTTASVIRPPPARPCKLTFGEKFDYTVSDVHELVRRHVPLPMTGPPTSKSATANSAFGIQKYSGGVFNVVNADEFDVWRIPARLNCIWNHMYAGWSGHVKFRIFVYGSQPGLVWYVPHDLNPSFTVPTDAAEVVLGPADTRIATGTGTDVFHSTQYPGNIPREMTYPYTSNCSMIDVSVPFCSQYNILPNWERRVEVPDALANWDNGYLYLRVIKGTHVEIFQAAGDDFRFHVYCPDNGVRGKLLQQVGATTTAFASGDRIGGYYK